MKRKEKLLFVLLLAGMLIVFAACSNGTNGTGGTFIPEYEVGDTGPGGGIIFYVDPEGFTVQGYTGGPGAFAAYKAHYLEAAPDDEAGSSTWGDYGTLITGVTTFTSSSAADAAKIGNGRKDTRTIVNHLAGTVETGKAAQLCAGKDLNGYTDWFLPSLGELDELYKLYDAEGKAAYGNLTQTHYYWSSSQYNLDRAWNQYFANGNQYCDNTKAGTFGVRAIRAF